MSFRQWIIGATAALSISPIAAPYASASPSQPCSASKFWSESQERGILGGPGRNSPAQKKRDAAYTKFMDSFWSSIDRQLAAKKPQTVGDVFGDIQTAFVAASNQNGQAIRAFGVTPRLLIDDFKCALGGDCKGRVFTVGDLQHGSVIDNPVVQGTIGNNAQYGKFGVDVQFMASPSNYLVDGVLNDVKAGLSKNSPATSISMPERDDNWFSNALQRALTCVAK